MSPWLVTGRYCPTDANPDTEAEDEVTTMVVGSSAEAMRWLLWYPGGIAQQVVEDPARCEGGSSCLCECAGVDTGRHAEWCHSLNLYVPVKAA